MSKLCFCPCTRRHWYNMDHRKPRSESDPSGTTRSYKPSLNDINARPRSQSQTEDMTREKHSVKYDRRRSVSDPPNGISKFFKNLGLGYLATLASLTRTSPKINHMRGRYEDLPVKNVAPISSHVLSAYSGPNGGLTNIKIEKNGEVKDESEKRLREGNSKESTSGEEDSIVNTEQGRQLSVNSSNSNKEHRNDNEASQIDRWSLRKDWAYGISVSLYEYKSDDTTECTGDPVADVIAIKTTENSAILGVADGCGWGYGSRRAARCAIKGCMDHIAKCLYSRVGEESAVHNTADIFKIMRDSVDEGQKLVIGATATLTTLVLSVVTQLANSKEFVVCTMNIGDSLAYVFSEEHGVRELTIGCRDMDSHRNIRFCDGALGPALGDSPDLSNMTFSISVVKKGDVVFLTSDGVSDNFDPVIAGLAEASPEFNRRGGGMEPVHNGGIEETAKGSESSQKEKRMFSPSERQEQTELQMNDILREDSIPNENLQSAHAVCSKLLQYTIENTEVRRRAQQSANAVVLERAKNPDHRTLPEHPDNTAEGLRTYLRSLPGKLDHGSVVAYVVGMHGIEEQVEDEEEENKEQEIAERKETKVGMSKESEAGLPGNGDHGLSIN